MKAELEYGRYRVFVDSQPRLVDVDFEQAAAELKKLPSQRNRESFGYNIRLSERESGWTYVFVSPTLSAASMFAQMCVTIGRVKAYCVSVSSVLPLSTKLRLSQVVVWGFGLLVGALM